MPARSTAQAFDSLIRELDRISSTNDSILSVEEMALGVPLAIRSLDICWGYAPIDAEIVADSGCDLIIGKGLCRRDGVFQPPNYLETAFNFTNPAILGTIPLSNVYAFGSIYLLSSAANTLPSVELVLSTGGGAGPLFLCQQISLNDAMTLLANGAIPQPIAPTGGYALEVLKFIININTYNYSAPWLNDFTVYPLDTRKNRGFGGFADENMAVSLIPTIIGASSNINNGLISVQKALQTLIKDWVMLPSWAPDFVTYWQSNYVYLPSRLREYLLSEVGIIISPPGM